MRMVTTIADADAWNVLSNLGIIDSYSSGTVWAPNKAGNYIIAFAERIKAERAVAAMQGDGNDNMGI